MGETLRLTGRYMARGCHRRELVVEIALDDGEDCPHIPPGSKFTLEITLPDPPMPKCPPCGVTEGRGEDIGHRAHCLILSCFPCDIELSGPCRPTKAEAVAAFRKIVREPT